MDIISNLQKEDIYEIDFNALVPFDDSWKLLLKLIGKYDRLTYMNLSYSSITEANVDEILTVLLNRNNKVFTLEIKGIKLNKHNLKSIRDIRVNPHTPDMNIIVDEDYNKRINVTWSSSTKTKKVMNHINYYNNIYN
jgi:hypothetical protein